MKTHIDPQTGETFGADGYGVGPADAPANPSREEARLYRQRMGGRLLWSLDGPSGTLIDQLQAWLLGGVPVLVAIWRGGDGYALFNQMTPHELEGFEQELLAQMTGAPS